MNENRFRIIEGVLVGLFFLIALCLRVIPPFDKVFAGDWVKFTGVDAYYQMRIVDNLVHNFPHLNTFDPYLLYPEGGRIGAFPFFNYLLAFVIWVLGLGSPSQHLVDVVGVYFPAVLGALVVVPVYFIGKGIFGRWAGVIAGGLVGIYPGEFLGRSILGFTDYHVAEVLFTSVAMAFLVYAVKSGREADDVFKAVKGGSWGKLLMYSVLAGIFLGIYFLTWMGALLFVLIVFIFLVIQLMIDHLKGRSVGYLGVIGVVVFGIGLLMFLPARPDAMFVVSLVIGVVVPVVLVGLSRVMAWRKMNVVLYPVVVIAVGVVGLIALRLIASELFDAMVGSLGIFKWVKDTTVYEMQAILYPGGKFSWLVVWLNFTTGFFLSFISMGILIYQIIKKGEGEKVLLVVWSVVMLLATLAMRRFAYYYVVNVALLSGYVSWMVLEFAGFREKKTEVVEVVEKSRKKHRRERGRQEVSGTYMTLAAIAVFLLVFYPNIGPLPRMGQIPPGTQLSVALAKNPSFVPSDGWCEALDWLREKTPEPFGDASFYYAEYEVPKAGEQYKYPDSAYGVACWWDYGYWVTRIGKRMPISNPGIGHHGEAFLLTAQDEAGANKFMDSRGVKYVVVNFQTAMEMGMFNALAMLSGGEPEKYYDIYYQLQQGQLVPVWVFYPEYYSSLLVRLYNFDGKGVVPESTTVISYREMPGPGGTPYKVINSSQSFKTYGEALDNISARKGEKVEIVGKNPLFSAVPLEPLGDYKLIYSSKSSKTIGEKTVAEVKIFEYKERPAAD